MIRVEVIHPIMLDEVWDQCEPHLQRVVDRSHGELTLDSIKSKVITSNCILFAIYKGDKIIAVNTAETRVMESGLKALFIPITCGEHLDEWMVPFLDVAKSIAKRFGCTELRGLSVRTVKDAWTRKLESQGWEALHTVIKCNIEAQPQLKEVS